MFFLYLFSKFLFFSILLPWQNMHLSATQLFFGDKYSFLSIILFFSYFLYKTNILRKITSLGWQNKIHFLSKYPSFWKAVHFFWTVFLILRRSFCSENETKRVFGETRRVKIVIGTPSGFLTRKLKLKSWSSFPASNKWAKRPITYQNKAYARPSKNRFHASLTNLLQFNKFKRKPVKREVWKMPQSISSQT